MTPRERAAYDAGIRAALDMARVAAVTLEAGPDGGDLRKRAAAGALYAFADAARTLALSAKPDPGHTVMAAIALQPQQTTTGELPCPVCAGRVRWARDASNGHIHAECEAGCFRVIQ